MGWAGKILLCLCGLSAAIALTISVYTLLNGSESAGPAVAPPMSALAQPVRPTIHELPPANVSQSSSGPCSPNVASVKIEGSLNFDCSQTHPQIILPPSTIPAPIRDNGYQDQNPTYRNSTAQTGEATKTVGAQQTLEAASSVSRFSGTDHTAPILARGLNIEVTACQRDNDNRIACLMVVTNFEMPIQLGIQFGTCCVIYDEQGNEATIVYAMIGNVGSAFTRHTGYVRSQLMQHVQTKIFIRFDSALAGATQVKVMQLRLKIADRFHFFTFENIPIV